MRIWKPEIKNILNSPNQRICKGHVVVEKPRLRSCDPALFQSEFVGECLERVILVLADYYITDGLLVVPADGLSHSGHGRWDQHSNLQIHGVIGDIHFMMLDCELDLGGDNIWVLIYWDLVDWGIVLLLLLLLGFLLFLRRHRPVSVYNYRLVSFLVLIITQIPQPQNNQPTQPPNQHPPKREQI